MRGTKDGRQAACDLLLYHDDGYAFTAIPVAATMLQYLDGAIRRPGLSLQAHIVDPERLLEDMERLGIQVQYRGARTVEEQARLAKVRHD